MKTIAFVVTSLDSGGIENYLLRFLKFSVGEFRPVVICKSGRTGELEGQYLEVPEIEIIPVNVGYGNPSALLKVYQTCKKFNVSVICDFTGNFSGLILALSWIINIRTRIAFYRGAAIRFKPTKLKLFYNAIMKALVNRFATKILSNSLAALNVFYPDRDRNNNRFKVIYNGVDSEAFNIKQNRQSIRKELGISDRAFIIGHVGRNDVSKNLKTIGDVAQVVCRKHTNIYFVFCGKGTERFVKNLIDEAPDLKDRFVSLGYRSDVNRILQIYDLFIFPSIIEGQPNALIEALIAGLPVVASDIAPIVETLPESMKQYLKDPHDINGFVDQIERCYTDESYRKDHTNQEWAVKNFNPNLLFDQFLLELT